MACTDQPILTSMWTRFQAPPGFEMLPRLSLPNLDEPTPSPPAPHAASPVGQRPKLHAHAGRAPVGHNVAVEQHDRKDVRSIRRTLRLDGDTPFRDADESESLAKPTHPRTTHRKNSAKKTVSDAERGPDGFAHASRTVC